MNGGFPEAARVELANPQLRANLRNATDTIRAKRARVVGELPDWEELRESGRGIKADVLHHLVRAPTGAGKTATAVLGWIWRYFHSGRPTPRR